MKLTFLLGTRVNIEMSTLGPKVHAHGCTCGAMTGIIHGGREIIRREE